VIGGAGMIALFVIQLLKLAGCSKIIEDRIPCAWDNQYWAGAIKRITTATSGVAHFLMN